MKSPATQIFQGRQISPGMAEGKIHIHRILYGLLDMDESIESREADDEVSRLDNATLKISDDLCALASRVEKEIDSRLAEVFSVHQLILEDDSLKEELRKEIVSNLVTAGSAVKTVFLRWEKRFLLMESQISKDKGDDMRDLSIRLRNALAGITIHSLEEIPPGCVLATKRLLPSDTIFLRSRDTAAVLLEFGTFGSHVALFTREMGLPCISGLRHLITTVPDGSNALVDADAATATIDPDEQQINRFRKKVERNAAAFRLALDHTFTPAQTKDGVVITVLANIGSDSDTRLAMENGAEGVGLYRTEKAYIGRLHPPNDEELYQEMLHTLAPAKGEPVCVRLLDIGADKPLPFMKFMAESNPSLGCRGIRLLRRYPELLDTQLRTVLKLAKEFDIQILVPMVTLPDDMAIVKDRLSQISSEMDINMIPKLGAMIETPGAALSASEIAKYSDFLSFGTNDLTQYTFAADRENAEVEAYFNHAADAIFRLMNIVHDDVPEMPLSLCGELAGRSEHISKILECGIKTLSIAPPLIPGIKESVRESYCTGSPR